MPSEQPREAICVDTVSKQCVCLVLQNLKLCMSPTLLDAMNESSNQIKAYLDGKLKNSI